MTKILHGIVRGKTIEVTEDLEMSDGQAVELLLLPANSREPRTERGTPETAPKELPGPPPGWSPGAPSRAAGILANEWTEEDDRILEQIQADRKLAQWREPGE